MIRRRLFLATLAAMALGAAWLWFATGLSAEERRLVGTWWYVEPDTDASHWTNKCRLDPDGRCLSGSAWGPWPSGPEQWWSARNGILTIDGEPGGLRRAFRPVATFLGYLRRPELFGTYELNGDLLTVTTSDGNRQAWARMPPDWLPPANRRHESAISKP